MKKPAPKLTAATSKTVNNVFTNISPFSWSATIPFELNSGFVDDVFVETPQLTPGWYSVSMAFVITGTPESWMSPEPRDIRCCMNFNTEGSTVYEETTPYRRTSDFRTLSTDIAGNHFQITYPWPWGAWKDVFHTTQTDVAYYGIGWDGFFAQGEIVTGYVYLLLKKED